MLKYYSQKVQILPQVGSTDSANIGYMQKIVSSFEPFFWSVSFKSKHFFISSNGLAYFTTNKLTWRIIILVVPGSGIQTHNLLDMRLLP